MTIPAGYSQVNLLFTGANLPHGAEVTFGVDNQGPQLSPTGVATAVNTQVGNSGLISNLSDQTILSGIRVKNGPDSTGPSAEISVSHTGAGGASTQPNTAFLVRKNTSLGGRAGRGRFYLPVPADSQVGIDGFILAATRTAIQADLDALLAGLDGANLPMVLLHGAGAPITVPTEVTSLTLDAQVGTQRRRLRG